MPQDKKIISWGPVDKDQLGYESNYNPEGVFHDGPRTSDNNVTISVDKLEDVQDQ